MQALSATMEAVSIDMWAVSGTMQAVTAAMQAVTAAMQAMSTATKAVERFKLAQNLVFWEAAGMMGKSKTAATQIKLQAHVPKTTSTGTVPE